MHGNLVAAVKEEEGVAIGYDYRGRLVHTLWSGSLDAGRRPYYGITGNSRRLGTFRYYLHRIGRKWLSRRSQRSRRNWEAFNRLLARLPLPPAAAVHSRNHHAANP